MENLEKLDFNNVTKSNFKMIANHLASAVTDGVINSLDAYTRLKAIEAMVVEARKQITGSAKFDLEKYNKAEKLVVNGYTLSERETGVSYDFADCGDAEWTDCNNKIENLKLILKERETFLKTIKTSLNLVNDDGEPITLYAPVKTSTTSIVCG